MQIFHDSYGLRLLLTLLLLDLCASVEDMDKPPLNHLQQKSKFYFLRRLLALRQKTYDTATESNTIPDMEPERIHEQGNTTPDHVPISGSGDFFNQPISIPSNLAEGVTVNSVPPPTPSTARAEHAVLSHETVIDKVRRLLGSALPRLKRILELKNETNFEQHRGELLELAAQIQPLLGPLAKANPNFTAQINAFGTGLAQYNRTARGWGGGCQSCCCGGGGWGGGGGLPYLLMNNNNSNDSLLQTLLPLLFGLIALLIMKLPT